MANTYLKALQERGHDPNLIVVTQPVKRDKSLKELLNFMQSQQRSYHPQPTLKQSTNTQRMPLRMLVSQKAERTSSVDESGPFKSNSVENTQLSIPPYNMDNGISSCLKISKRQSQQSANSSVRMLLQNPYVTKFSSSSRNSQNNSHNITRVPDLKPFLFHNKTKVHSINHKKHNFADKAQCSHVKQTYIPSQVVEQHDEGITNCGNDNILGSLQHQKQREIKLFDHKEKANEENRFFNHQDIEKSPLHKIWEENCDTDDTTDVNNSPMSVLSSSEKIERESFGFIWTPVQCSSSNIDKCNFLGEIELTENFSFSFSNLNNS